MGGNGSGRWFRTDRKMTVDKCLSINILDFDCNVRSCLTGKISWISKYSNKKFSSISYAFLPEDDTEPIIVLSYKIENHLVDETIILQSTKPHFGGSRWWFTCPLCKSRMGKLYLPPKSNYFACRRCHDLRHKK